MSREAVGGRFWVWHVSREAASDRFGWYLIYLGILYWKICFIVLLSAQKRDINHVGQKNPFLDNRISCHYGEDSCNGQRKRERDACKLVQSWYRNSQWAEKKRAGCRKVSPKRVHDSIWAEKGERWCRKVSPKLIWGSLWVEKTGESDKKVGLNYVEHGVWAEKNDWRGRIISPRLYCNLLLGREKRAREPEKSVQSWYEAAYGEKKQAKVTKKSV